MPITQKDIDEFIKIVSKDYDLNESELTDKWNEMKKSPAKKISLEVSRETLTKSTVVNLKAVCKERTLRVSGTKAELIQRILDDINGVTTSPTKKCSPVKKILTKKTTEKIKEEEADKIEKTSQILKKIKNPKQIELRKNTFGNLCHPESSLVFHFETKKVMGKQLDDGDVAQLTRDDIEYCKRYNFDYVIPTNLDAIAGTLEEEESSEEIITEKEIDDDESEYETDEE